MAEYVFPFRFVTAYLLAGLPFGIVPSRAVVIVGDDTLNVRFGSWRLRTPLGNVRAVTVTGPYGWLKTAGPPRLSLADRGLTCATNPDRGVCVAFHRPVPGLDPLGVLRHSGVTVTVDDVEGLHDLLLRRAPADASPSR